MGSSSEVALKTAPLPESLESACSQRTPSTSIHPHLIAEIEKILEVVRGSQPGIHNLKAKKLEARFKRELSLYFRRMSRNIPYSDLPGYLERNAVVKEALTPDDEALRIAAEVTEEMSQRLDSIIRKNVESGYLLGATQAHQLFRLEPTFELIDDGAVQWMNRHSARMVTKINQTTRDELARTLTRGARMGESVPKLAKRIRSEVLDMANITKGRAQLIANTELNEAMSEASLQTYKRLNIPGKSWSTVGDDRVSDECRSNQAAGIIPMNEAFPGGVQRPPQHPACRCTLVPEKTAIV